MESIASLSTAYWTHWRLRRGQRQERLESESYAWAWERVDDLASNGAPDAIPVLIQLATDAPSEAALAYLGAGPIEDLLAHPAVAADLESAARRHPRLRNALASAWRDSR